MVETRSMNRKMKRLMMQISSWPDAPAIFESLNDDTLTTVLEFVGNKSYKSFGGVNKQCREVYLATKGMTKETFLYGYAPLSVIKDRIIQREDHHEIVLKLCVGVGKAVVFYNRRDVMDWAFEERNDHVLKEICFVAGVEERFDLLDKVWSNVEDEESSRRCIFGDFCQFAARHGKLEILKWFGTKGTKYRYFRNYSCLDEAAKHGQLHIMKWLREENGLKLCGYLHGEGIEGGQLHVLKWLREQEVDWTDRNFKHAARKGNLDILQWLHDEGCPWPRGDAYRVYEGVLKPEVLDWLRANGYGDRITFAGY